MPRRPIKLLASLLITIFMIPNAYSGISAVAPSSKVAASTTKQATVSMQSALPAWAKATAQSKVKYDPIIQKIAALEAKAMTAMYDVYKLRRQVERLDDDLIAKSVMDVTDFSQMEDELNALIDKVLSETYKVKTTKKPQVTSAKAGAPVNSAQPEMPSKNIISNENQSIINSIRIKHANAEALLKTTEDALNAEYKRIFPLSAPTSNSAATGTVKAAATASPSVAQMMGGEAFLLKPDYYRAVMFFFQTQLRRNIGSGMQTEIANLRYDADCTGDIVADQSVARYGIGLVDQNFTSALLELHKFTRVTECLSSRQLAAVDWAITRAIFMTMNSLRKEKQKDFVMLITNPALILFDIRKPFFSPMLAFFKKYNSIISEVYVPTNAERFTSYNKYLSSLATTKKPRVAKFDQTTLSHMGIYLVNRSTGSLQFVDFAKGWSGRSGSEYKYIEDVPQNISAFFGKDIKSVYNQSVSVIFATFCNRCISSFVTEGYCVGNMPELPVSWGEFAKRVIDPRLLGFGASGFLETAFLGRPDTMGICVMPPFNVASGGGSFSCDLSPSSGGEGQICSPTIIGGGGTNPVAMSGDDFSNPKHFKQGLNCGKVDPNAPISGGESSDGPITIAVGPYYEGTEPKEPEPSDDVSTGGTVSTVDQKGESNGGYVSVKEPTGSYDHGGGNTSSGSKGNSNNYGQVSGGSSGNGKMNIGGKVGGAQYETDKEVFSGPFTSKTYWKFWMQEFKENTSQSNPTLENWPQPMSGIADTYGILPDWSNLEDIYRDQRDMFGSLSFDNPDSYEDDLTMDINGSEVNVKQFTTQLLAAGYLSTIEQINLAKLENIAADKFIGALEKYTNKTYSSDTRTKAIEYASQKMKTWQYGAVMDFKDYDKGLVQEVEIVLIDGELMVLYVGKPYASSEIAGKKAPWYCASSNACLGMHDGYYVSRTSIDVNGKKVSDGVIYWDANTSIDTRSSTANGEFDTTLLHEGMHALGHYLRTVDNIPNNGTVDHEITYQFIDGLLAPNVDKEVISTGTSKNYFTGYADQGLSGSNGGTQLPPVNMGQGHKICNPLTGACGSGSSNSNGGKNGGGGVPSDNPLYMPNPLSDGVYGGGSCTAGQATTQTFYNCIAGKSSNPGPQGSPSGPDPCPPDICGYGGGGMNSEELACSIGDVGMKMPESAKLWDPKPNGLGKY